jgi:prolyl-tRNA synthetase
MLRAGMIHQIAAGIFDILPLALRIKHKIEDIIREEMDAVGGQEVTLPMVHPAEIWQKTAAAGTRSAATWRASRTATVATWCSA